VCASGIIKKIGSCNAPKKMRNVEVKNRRSANSLLARSLFIARLSSSPVLFIFGLEGRVVGLAMRIRGGVLEFCDLSLS
jgi:hypothetical protein